MSAAKRGTRTAEKGPAALHDELQPEAGPATTELEPMEAGEEEAGAEARDERRKWYVIHTYSGYENKVKANLEHRIDSMGVRDKIFQVIVPTVEEIDIKDGQRRTMQRKVFPGYVLVEMIMG